jgi:NADH-quinone oxidoreductase subunit E
MPVNSEYLVADEIIANHEGKESNLIAILQDIQKEYRYLPQDLLMYLSTAMGISPAKVFSVATFYENFSLNPKGKYVIKICDGTACHVRKSVAILNTLRKELGLNEEKTTTDDLLFTVETVSCLGACGLAPVITVNDVVHPRVTPEGVVELLNTIREGEKNAN